MDDLSPVTYPAGVNRPTTNNRRRKPQALRHLPPESWGKRLQRARMEVADLTVYTAAEHASHYWPTTHATVNRIEQLTDAPDRWTAGNRRALSYVLTRVYGVYPADWGLSRDDVPPSVADAIDADYGPETPSHLEDQPSR